MIYSQTRAELQHPSTKDEYLVNDNSHNSSREDFFHHNFEEKLEWLNFIADLFLAHDLYKFRKPRMNI